MTSVPTRTALFVTEGSPTIGMGHISRCRTLARALGKQGLSSSFLLRGEQPFAQMLEEDGHHTRFLASWVEVERTVRDVRPKVLLLDSYSITPSTFGSETLNLQLTVLLDDYVDRPYSHVDLAVNPVTHIPAAPPKGAALLGPEYALINQAFAHTKRSALPDFDTAPERIGVVLGGTDPTGTTSALLSLIQAVWPLATVEVPGLTQLPLLQTSPQVALLGQLTPWSMADFFRRADLVFATPSTVAWELSAVGTPTILVETVENHAAVANMLSRVPGVLVARGLPEKEAVLDYWASLSSHALKGWSSLCDGKGAERVAKEVVTRIY